MVVLHLTNCPLGLRGDLTRWLLEVSSGVFVGQVSARVRDAIWQRIRKNCKTGRATLVYSSDGEQRLNFRVHGDVWEPIDFDGIKLMLRPSSSRLATKQTPQRGFSDAAKHRKAKRYPPKAQYPSDYVVIDVETTGLNPDTDDIMEIGAIKVIMGNVTEAFHALIHIEKAIPPAITKLTGITDEMLRKDGVPPKEALQSFTDFFGDMPLIAHNASFDMSFLLRACKKHGIPLFSNRSIDTLTLAQRHLRGLPNHKLATISAHFGLTPEGGHRSRNDCEVTMHVYEKLIKISSMPLKESQ